LPMVCCIHGAVARLPAGLVSLLFAAPRRAQRLLSRISFAASRLASLVIGHWRQPLHVGLLPEHRRVLDVDPLEREVRVAWLYRRRTIAAFSHRHRAARLTMRNLAEQRPPRSAELDSAANAAATSLASRRGDPETHDLRERPRRSSLEVRRPTLRLRRSPLAGFTTHRASLVPSTPSPPSGLVRHHRTAPHLAVR
jgi:hypothetical protein